MSCTHSTTCPLARIFAGKPSLRIWSEDGRLLGVAQQTCIIRTSHHNVA